VELEDLRTFIEVADAGGLSAAARRLAVSKSIVSRGIFRLEDALGVQLLARTTRGVCLTEAGLTFREYASRVCGELDVALETIPPARCGTFVFRFDTLRACVRGARPQEPASSRTGLLWRPLRRYRGGGFRLRCSSWTPS
jgi:DNA-binding transcriptional LysR family regulator